VPGSQTSTMPPQEGFSLSAEEGALHCLHGCVHNNEKNQLSMTMGNADTHYGGRSKVSSKLLPHHHYPQEQVLTT
jgi:hypothetical protein